MRGFLEKMSGIVWHLGCVNRLVAGVGRPSGLSRHARLGSDPTVKLIHLKGRLLSSNIGKLNSAAPAAPPRTAGSIGKTVISHLGDFFAVPFEPIAMAHPRRVAGEAS